MDVLAPYEDVITLHPYNQKNKPIEEFEKALNMSRALFSGDVSKLSANDIEVVFKDIEKVEISNDMNLVDMLVEKKICSSKREAREFVTAGTISINGEKITDLELVVNKEMAIEGKYLIVRRGKKKYHMLEWV